MPIFRLDPIDLTHRDWRSSTYRSRVIVRAPNPRLARLACMLAFNVATKLELGQTTPSMPWMHDQRASCEPVESPQWSAEGPTEILHPGVDLAEIRRHIAELIVGN